MVTWLHMSERQDFGSRQISSTMWELFYAGPRRTYARPSTTLAERSICLQLANVGKPTQGRARAIPGLVTPLRAVHFAQDPRWHGGFESGETTEKLNDTIEGRETVMLEMFPQLAIRYLGIQPPSSAAVPRSQDRDWWLAMRLSACGRDKQNLP